LENLAEAINFLQYNTEILYFRINYRKTEKKDLRQAGSNSPTGRMRILSDTSYWDRCQWAGETFRCRWTRFLVHH